MQPNNRSRVCHADIILIDIAESLSSPSLFTRKGGVTVTQPFKVSEPRSGVPFDQGLVDRYGHKKQWIQDSLAVLHQEFGDRFPLRPPATDSADLQLQDTNEESGPDLLAFQESLGAILQFFHGDVEIDLTAISLQELSLADVYGTVQSNPLPFWITLKLAIDKSYEYMVPPRSSFLLGPFTSTIPAFTSFACASRSPGFDFILLDPPWPNRSAHRAKHQNAYKTSTFDVYDLFKLNVPKSLRTQGLLGIWVTNSTKWRTFVFDKLFPAWKVRPVAEWLWVKITNSGEPIFDLDSIVRKPYESLILVRPDTFSDLPAPVVPDKAIFAMPDIHSRKPCLKGLVEPYLPPEPRCAEIFARNLTEGWFSWGNEVLKGNWRGCWV
ncbi:hypothetical protein ABW21_db0205640 [Orbilia brochopaga]|nr:hypothetical protein ABW21_db0205640 [Drechslerella brochopaga]